MVEYKKAYHNQASFDTLLRFCLFIDLIRFYTKILSDKTERFQLQSALMDLYDVPFCSPYIYHSIILT